MSGDAIWLLVIIVFVGAAAGMLWHFEWERQRHIRRDYTIRGLRR